MQGFKQAKAITKKYAKTFYFASLLLRTDKRLSSYSLYAICRISDETVDAEESGIQEDLLKLKEKIASVYDGSGLNNDLLLAFRKTVNDYEIPKHYFDELIQGMSQDLEKKRYKNFSELYDYCYKVAGVVGLMMLKIFGYKDVRAEEYAVKLGIAMQLTNILRDIKEDFSRGRIYLPGEEMNSFGISEEHLLRQRVDENFFNFMKFQIKRAREYYQASEEGIPLIEDRQSRLVVKAMKEMYSGILNSIEKNQYDVFSKRAHVNLFSKLWILLGLILKDR